jgi:hypothetical protein
VRAQAAPKQSLGAAAAAAIVAAGALLGTGAPTLAADLALGKNVFEGNCGAERGRGGGERCVTC